MKNRGFTILFAVVVSSLILSIGLSIGNIILKQIKISALGRDSQVAFYAADSASECVMYFDLISQAFSTSSESFGDPKILDEIECFGVPIAVFLSSEEEWNATTTVPIEINTVGNNVCATVQIGKYDTDEDGYSDKTVILSRGYNTCDETNDRRLERGLRVTY